MQVTITGQHVKITDTSREYSQQKLTCIDRHFGPAIRSHVMLSMAKHHRRVKPTVCANSAHWHAAAEDKDMYSTIDRVVSNHDRQAIKHKKTLSTTIKKRVD